MRSFCLHVSNVKRILIFPKKLNFVHTASKIRKNLFVNAMNENVTDSVCKRFDLKACPWVAVTPDLDTTSLAKIIGHYTTEQTEKNILDDYRRNLTTKLNTTLKEIYEEWQRLGAKRKSKQLIASYRAAYAKLGSLLKSPSIYPHFFAEYGGKKIKSPTSNQRSRTSWYDIKFIKICLRLFFALV